MRRRTASFAWISMLDLLSGVFGALIVLSVLISLKLGTEEPIARQPFHLIAVEMAPVDATSSSAVAQSFEAAFGETYLGFQIEDETGRYEGQWSAAVSSANDAFMGPARFVSASGATGKISAALFISKPETYQGMVLRPVLHNVARLKEWSNRREWTIDDLRDLKVSVRISAKSGSRVCDPPPFDVRVPDLMTRAVEPGSRGARIIPDEHLDARGPKGVTLVCGDGTDGGQGVMSFRGGAIELP